MRFVGGPAVRDLCLQSISVSNGGAELISDCDVTLVWGRKYGLVGRNGAGKSTFLRALSSGEIKGVPSNCQILHVEQEISGGDETVLDCVLQCDAERIELLDELKRREESGEDSAGLLERLHAIDAFGAEAHAATILSGLQFTPEMQLQSTRCVFLRCFVVCCSFVVRLAISPSGSAKSPEGAGVGGFFPQQQLTHHHNNNS